MKIKAATKINKELEDTTINDMSLQIRKLFELAEERQELLDIAKKKQKEIDETNRIISEILEKNSMTKFDSSYGSVYLRTRTNAKITDKNLLIKHLGQEAWYCLSTINSMTLSAWAKGLVERENEKGNFQVKIPGIQINETITVSKRKNKKETK